MSTFLLIATLAILGFLCFSSPDGFMGLKYRRWMAFSETSLGLKSLPLSSHSYSDRFASFDSFNSFSADTFDFSRNSPENSATYSFASLVRSLPYHE